ncbi:MAG TPA: NrfD/PsrC family molybdoenzyme membrane anchor subunit [Myxococcales bacterium]|nr:NrfD/PsrC family molybdoenzyme membrane anchor subunit [Myxococcales bacterium]
MKRHLLDDGRNIDRSLGILAGEGAHQEVRERSGKGARPVPDPPERAESTADADSYYGLPMLKEPVWKWPIPTYFYVGGVAGASAVLGAAAGRTGDPALRSLCERTRLFAAGGAMASAALLIWDLGRPSRFLNMMRVFRPTSPMNLGTWIISAFGGFATVAALLRKHRSGPLGAFGDASATAAGCLGLPLAGYTGVLLASTSVPLWQGARTALPPLFMASAVTSAASALDLCTLPPAAQRAVRRFGIAGKIAEIVLATLLVREAGTVPRVVQPLHESKLWKASKLSVAASLAAGVLRMRRAAGWLGTLGSLALRFSIVRAGRASTLDARAAFEQQRARLGAAEVTRPAPEVEQGSWAPVPGRPFVPAGA